MTHITKTLVVATFVASTSLPALFSWGSHSPEPLRPAAASHLDAPPVSATALDDVVDRYCVRCHNARRLTGNLSLEDFRVESAHAMAETSEKMIVKLRAEMMPPAGARRPPADTLLALVETLENTIDAAYRADPDPGSRMFQRLNRAEYAASIKDLLGLEIDAGDYLPVDPKSANFDNIADAQNMSPTLLDSYLRAAISVTRIALGVPEAAPTSVTYTNTGFLSQWERVPGAPRGTRGGLSVIHDFPADGDYSFRAWFEHTTTGGFMGATTPGEQLEISVDGERVVLLEVDRWMHPQDPNGASMAIDPVFVTAGPHRVTAAFLQLGAGPQEALISPHDWSLADRHVGASGYGTPALAHLKDLVILGPENPRGVSETPTRRFIFSCYPSSPEEARPCAQEIVERLAPRAFRRPLTIDDRRLLMSLYDETAADGDFESGVRTVIQGILSMPDFVFRIERTPVDVEPGDTYRISDLDLASRLSFFLWGAPPDDELIELASRTRLSDPGGLRRQVQRMLQDPRAEALGPRFAGQWLRLADISKVDPDRQMFPDFHQQLADAMVLETELFFNYLVRQDRSVLDLYRADYTLVNERLAKHYGILGVSGEEFRRVQYPDATRRGLFGHGSILVLTSHANRTSPVLRGKWVMEVLMGTPPPPPPPGVPTLEETEGAKDGRLLTTRERMEVHRANPTCASCHNLIDPIGLALDNFDVTGKWRIRENGTALDTQGELYEGTPVSSPAELQQALLERPIPLVRTFTTNLMAYALGRRVEYTDMPEIRRIAAEAADEGYRISAFIRAIVESDTFQMKRATAVTQEQRSP